MEREMKTILTMGIFLISGIPVRPTVTTADDLKPGLLGEYFAFGEAPVEDFPTIAAGKKVTLRKLDKELNWDPTHGKFNGTDQKDHFYVRWTGIVRIPKDGTFTFFTEGDDGSRLWVDTKQVVENGGQHSMVEKNGKIELKAGDHEFKVDLFQNVGAVGLKVRWETEGVSKQIIPASVLFHQADPDLDKPK
jgi:hypothetical protein